MKVVSLVAVGVCALLLSSLAANARDDVRASCRAQVRAIWPVGDDGSWHNRDRMRLFRACLSNGGRIPG
jgi:hypothetical protein